MDQVGGDLVLLAEHFGTLVQGSGHDGMSGREWWLEIICDRFQTGLSKGRGQLGVQLVRGD